MHRRARRFGSFSVAFGAFGALVALVVVAACSGADKDGLFVDAPLAVGQDASVVDASATPTDARASDAPDVVPIVDAHVIDAFAASCVPREPTDGASPCRGSSECKVGEVCCAPGHDPSYGAAVGACSADGCDEDEVQLCTATCECLHGACQNAWPYEVHGSCR